MDHGCLEYAEVMMDMIPALCIGVFHRNEMALQVGTVWHERNEENNTLFVYYDSVYTP